MVGLFRFSKAMQQSRSSYLRIDRNVRQLDRKVGLTSLEAADHRDDRRWKPSSEQRTAEGNKTLLTRLVSASLRHRF